MNGDDIIDLISDSDEDADQQPAFTRTRSGQNGEGCPISFEDEDWQRSAPAPSSSRHNNNGQYRTPPPSFTKGVDSDSARHDSARGLSASKRVDSVGVKHDSSTVAANNNNKRVLPSCSNGNTSKSVHPNIASATRKLPPLFTDRKSQSLGENRMGIYTSKGYEHHSSSRTTIGSFNASSTQEENDDGMHS
jgi:hypothetical protein